MGALTLKSSPFVLRSWNVKNFDSLDPTDVFGQETNVYINKNKVAKIKLQFANKESNLWLTNRGRLLFLSFPTKTSYNKYLNKFYFRIRGTSKKFYFKTNHFFKQFLRKSLPNTELQVSFSTLLGMMDPTSLGPEGLILLGVFGAVALIMKVHSGIMRRNAEPDSESDAGSIDSEPPYDTPHDFETICEGLCGPRIQEITQTYQVAPETIAHFIGEISANDMTWPKLLLEATQAGEIHGNLATVSSLHGEVACLVMIIMGIDRVFVPVHQIAIVGRFFEIFWRSGGAYWDPGRRWGASHNPTNAEKGLLGSSSRFEIPQNQLNLLQPHLNILGRGDNRSASLPEMFKYRDIDLSNYYNRVNLFVPECRRGPVSQALYNLPFFGTRLFDITMKYGIEQEEIGEFVRQIVAGSQGKRTLLDWASQLVLETPELDPLPGELSNELGYKADYEDLIETAINMNGTYSWSDFSSDEKRLTLAATRYTFTHHYYNYGDPSEDLR